MWGQIAFACGGVALLVAVIIPISDSSYADNPPSDQNHHKFSDVFLTLKPGDKVTFTNKDEVMHDLVSVTPDYDVELGKLQPGASKTLVFKNRGVLELGCSRHPEMKMTIFVRTPVVGTDEAIVNVDTLHERINLLRAS